MVPHHAGFLPTAWCVVQAYSVHGCVDLPIRKRTRTPAKLKLHCLPRELERLRTVAVCIVQNLGESMRQFYLPFSSHD
ncbi:hypothetical protein GGS24DRAFT_268709 [Hypoxylon argillaceum]|nr:hypothetical protein GGS24DRAFT_268709 [Hypoxylon argillaceum]